MTGSLSEELSKQFYRWERRGRGWDIYEEPVDLEPPYAPFIFNPPRSPIIDDGFKPSLFSKVADSVKAAFNSADKTKKKETPQKEEQELKAFASQNDGPLDVLHIHIPKGQKVRFEEMEKLLVMLSDLQCAVSFEIIATHSSVHFQLVCGRFESRTAEKLITSFFPGFTVQNPGGGLSAFGHDDKEAFAVDLGLKEEFMRPLNIIKNLDIDPYIGLFSLFDMLAEDEAAMIQVLFQETTNSWSRSILESVSDSEGDSLFYDAPEMPQLAKEKVSSPLLGVVVRLITQAPTVEHARKIAVVLLNALNKVAASKTNSLIMLPFPEERADDYFSDLVHRRSRRLGMLLSGKELATIAHFPSASVQSDKLHTNTRKTKLASKATEGNEHFLGYNEHLGIQREVTVSSEQRLKHTHIIGATGTGKSSLILFSVLQDLLNGDGLTVLDPHGDLIENIIPYIPKERIDDVIIIDPSDSEYPVGFNILQAHSEIEKEILSSDLVAVFRRLSTSWGDQMNSVFANAILAFLESSEGGTLLDLRRFLIEKSFREEFLKTVNDPNIVYYWQKEFPILKSSSIGPILTRLDSFLRPKLIRNMVGQKKSLDFEVILDTKKILLVKLSQGLIGTENSYLLGTFIVSKIQQAAMARQAKAKSDRSNFYFYIDEFQNFITPSMSAILSGARKYHLGLILAHQDMQQLSKQDTELASSVVSNAGTRICFRLGDTDARKFESGFSCFDASDLQNLGIGEAIARVERSDYDFNLDVPRLHKVKNAEEIYNLVVEASREKYGTAKETLESLIQNFPSESANTILQDIGSSSNIKESSIVLPVTEKIELAALTEKQITETKNTIVKREEETRHRYLQTYIKKMAESRGYKATLEEPTPDSKGRVDVSLEKNNKRIAVEIKDTTTDEWELQNIDKCLNAGFDVVIACSEDNKAIERLSKKVAKVFDSSQIKKILILTPEELVSYFDSELAKDASTEMRIKGYRIKVDYSQTNESDANRIEDTIAKSIKQSKGKDKNNFD